MPVVATPPSEDLRRGRVSPANRSSIIHRSMEAPMIRKLTAFLAAATITLVAHQAFARCDIKNDTKWSFTIESGNTSNQRVGSHTSTSIASGKIVGKSDDGKTIGGFCKDGDKLIIKDEKGAPVLMPQ
jgi:hypothetical protein